MRCSKCGQEKTLSDGETDYLEAVVDWIKDCYAGHTAWPLTDEDAYAMFYVCEDCMLRISNSFEKFLELMSLVAIFHRVGAMSILSDDSVNPDSSVVWQ